MIYDEVDYHLGTATEVVRCLLYFILISIVWKKNNEKTNKWFFYLVSLDT